MVMLCVLRRPVVIDFDNLQTTNSAMRVQRRSLLPPGQTEDVGWYYRDDQLWLEYGCQVRTVRTLKNELDPCDFQTLSASSLPFSSSGRQRVGRLHQQYRRRAPVRSESSGILQLHRGHHRLQTRLLQCVMFPTNVTWTSLNVCLCGWT